MGGLRLTFAGRRSDRFRLADGEGNQEIDLSPFVGRQVLQALAIDFLRLFIPDLLIHLQKQGLYRRTRYGWAWSAKLLGKVCF